MRLTTLLISVLACLFSASLNAVSFNPFAWFNDEVTDEEIQPIRIASTEEEVAADRILNKGLQKFSDGHYSSANKQFKKVVKDYPTTQSAPEALFMRGRIYMEKKRYVKAYKFLQQTVDDYPSYQDFNLVISTQFESATALMEGARGRIFGIIPGFKQYGEAIEQFEGIVSNAPYGDYASLALMNIALVADKRNDSEVAIDALDRLINFYPQSMLAPDAYYNLAKTYGGQVQNAEYDQGSTRQAISYYEDYLVLFPQSETVGEVEANLKKMENLLASSRLLLGDFYYFHRANNTAALVFYNETITIAPDSEAAAEAQQRINDIEAGVRPYSGRNFLKKILFIK